MTRRVPAWLAAPAVAGLALLLVYPTICLVALAVTKSSLAKPLSRFTGLANFTDHCASGHARGALPPVGQHLRRGVRFAAPGADAAAVTLEMRPEDMLVAPSEHGNDTAEIVELLGPRYVFIVTAGAHRLTVVAGEGRPYSRT